MKQDESFKHGMMMGCYELEFSVEILSTAFHKSPQYIKIINGYPKENKRFNKLTLKYVTNSRHESFLNHFHIDHS